MMDVKAMLIAATCCAGFLLILVLIGSPIDEADDAGMRVRGRIILGSLFVGFVCAILAAGWPS